MTSAGKCLLWLTALTTASLTVTGCTGSDGRLAAAKEAVSTSSPHPELFHHHKPHGPGRISTPTEAAVPSPSTPVTEARQSFVLVVSDGTDAVRVAGRDVTFPGPVSEAVVSPNGLVIGFVDGQGDIATARLDGTGLRVLTSTDPGVRRAHPTFEDGGSEIVFSERGHDGVWRLKEVAADGHDQLELGKPDPTVEETKPDHGHDTAPNATWSQASHADSARSVLVFEHRTSRGRVKVYVADRNQRGFGPSPLLDGRSPAVSPTGDRIAFIGTAGQIQVQRLDARPRPRQVTWGAHPVGHLAWSPDGRRIFFSTSSDVESVSSIPLSPGHNPADVVLHHAGVASPGTVSRPAVGTFPGTDPVTAALAVSRARFVDGTQVPVDESSGYGVSWADHVTLVSTDDRTAAAPAAAIARGGPILFLPDGRLDPRVRDEILRLMQRPQGFRRGMVDIVGSPTAVSDSVMSELQSAHVRVSRFDPTTGAADVADALQGRDQTYVVVSQDDLSAVASSASATDPVLLTDGSTMPAATAAELDRMARDRYSATPAVYAVGRDAQAAVRSSWPGKRPFTIVDVGGTDVAGDSLAAVQGLYDAPGRLSVATSADWRAMLIAGMAGPTLVVAHRGLTPGASEWLAASQAVMRNVYVVGGSSALATTAGQAVFGDRYVLRRSPTDITQ